MNHSEVEDRVARWIAGAPFVVAAVRAFLRRFLPDVHADVADSLARGGRMRIIIDLDGDQVSRLRVRLLRPDDDGLANRTVYSWRPAEPSDVE